MLTPTFDFKVLDKNYSVSPSMQLMGEIESILGSSIPSAALNRSENGTSPVLSIKGIEIFKILKKLPCSSDFNDDELEKYIVDDPITAGMVIQSLIYFIMSPAEQEKKIKKK